MGENFWVVLDQPCLRPEADGHEEGMPWGVPASSWGKPHLRVPPKLGGLIGVLCALWSPWFCQPKSIFHFHPHHTLHPVELDPSSPSGHP